MSKVIVTCDSTCDLNADQYKRFGILTMPLYVRLGDEEHRDGVDLSNDQLFDYVKRTGQLPKTAAATVQDYYDMWKPYVDQGYEVVHINISSEFSVCHQNACTAAEMLGHSYVIDSRNLSSGSGHLAIDASELAAEGKSGQEIKEILDKKKLRLNVSFVLDTMEYLAKGGRCSSMTALAAGLLRLRLEIEVKNGKMVVGKKYRGKLENVLIQYVHDRLRNVDVETKRIFITYPNMDDEIVEKVRQAVLEEKPFHEVLCSNAGCTVASHCGPKCLGILFYEAEK